MGTQTFFIRLNKEHAPFLLFSNLYAVLPARYDCHIGTGDDKRAAPHSCFLFAASLLPLARNKHTQIKVDPRSLGAVFLLFLVQVCFLSFVPRLALSPFRSQTTKTETIGPF